MFSIYDKGDIIFSHGDDSIKFPFCSDFNDYEDTFVIETTVAIDEIVRGWAGDVRIILCGSRLDDTCHLNEDSTDVVLYRDVLCYRRTINISGGKPAVYKYMFMKY